MSVIAIGPAVESGFRLIRQRPLPVLLWGLVYVAFGVGSLALFAPVYLNMIARVAALSGVSAPPPPSGVIADALRMQGLGYLLTFASLILRSILMCAVCRAVQKPAEGRFGYLRLGMAEFYLLLIYVGAYLAIMLALMVPTIALAILTIALAAAHALPAAILIDILATLSFVAGLIYLALRFSMIAPMVVEDEKPHLLESWNLTRGHVGALFLVGLCLIGILIIAELIFGALLLFFGAGALGAAAGGLDRLTVFLAQPPEAIFWGLAPYIAVIAAIGVPLTGCAYAIACAPWARAYLDLIGRSPVVRTR